MTEIDKAIRLVLRRKRGRVSIIRAAIYAVSHEANMQGRLHPAPDGQSLEEARELERAVEAVAVRILRT